MNRTTGTVMIVTTRKPKSVIISKGTPISTKTPKTKNAPNNIKATDRNKKRVAKKLTPKPTTPLNRSVATITKEPINTLGIKNRTEGMA